MVRGRNGKSGWEIWHNDEGKRGRKSPCWRAVCRGEKKAPRLPVQEDGEPCFAVLLSGNRAHGAGALAGAAVDAGAGVDNHVVVAHGDRAHGAGALASTARNAGVTNLTSHVTYTSKCRLCFEPFLIVTYPQKIAIRNFDRDTGIISAKNSHPLQRSTGRGHA